jgi:hypothetical protein
VPALRTGALPASDTWLIEMLKPGARPAEAIAARLLALGGDARATASMQATLDGLLADERTLHLATTLALGEAPEQRLVWVIDQAEELFTLCHDERERAAVIDNLTYAASVPGGRVVVVLAMRADFYARAAAHPDLAAHISRAQHLVASKALLRPAPGRGHRPTTGSLPLHLLPPSVRGVTRRTASRC